MKLQVFIDETSQAHHCRNHYPEYPENKSNIPDSRDGSERNFARVLPRSGRLVPCHGDTSFAYSFVVVCSVPLVCPSCLPSHPPLMYRIATRRNRLCPWMKLQVFADTTTGGFRRC